VAGMVTWAAQSEALDCVVGRRDVVVWTGLVAWAGRGAWKGLVDWTKMVAWTGLVAPVVLPEIVDDACGAPGECLVPLRVDWTLCRIPSRVTGIPTSFYLRQNDSQ